MTFQISEKDWKAIGFLCVAIVAAVFIFVGVGGMLMVLEAANILPRNLLRPEIEWTGVYAVHAVIYSEGFLAIGALIAWVLWKKSHWLS